MPWLAISGIDLSAIAAVVGSPKGDRRDIGDSSPANDGTTRITRQARKRDFGVETIPLSGADAFAWESLVVGLGETWSFDTSLYGSKGDAVVPDDPADTTIQGSVKKYGAAALKTAGGEGISTPSGAAPWPTWTQAIWWRIDSGAWHHQVIRSDGATWADGVRNDAAAAVCFVLGTTASAILTTGANNYFDDWVVMPGLWPLSWAPAVYALGAAFSSLPYLNCSGDLVREAAVRRMVGKCTVAKLLRANPAGVSGGAVKDAQTLQIDLTEA